MNPAGRLAAVRERIDRACDASGRDPASVTLIAVSKTYPLDDLRALYDLGQRHFGESRLQEAMPKVDAMPNDVVWHFIGRLQSNKAKRAASAFDAIHTLTNEGQLREIEKSGRTLDGLVEVNLANEPQKDGLPPKKHRLSSKRSYNVPAFGFGASWLSDRPGSPTRLCVRCTADWPRRTPGSAELGSASA